MTDNRLIDTVIFDFHGTLTDHNKRFTVSLQRTCEDLGLPGEISRNIIENLQTQDIDATQKEFMRKHIPDGVFDQFWQVFTNYRNTLYFPVDGIRETIRKLQKSGVNILFLTNGSISNNDYAKLIEEKKSYTNIVWDFLVNQWHVFSGIGEDTPNILSIDDFDFISRRVKFLPKSIFEHRLHTSAEHDMPIYSGKHHVVKKPDTMIFKAVGTAITLLTERDFIPERTLYVTDYGEDADFGINHGMPTLMFMKGMRQYSYVIEGAQEVTFKGARPYFHTREIPYICKYGNQLKHEFTTFPQGEVEIKAAVEEKCVYKIKANPVYLQNPEFREYDLIEKERQHENRN